MSTSKRTVRTVSDFDSLLPYLKDQKFDVTFYNLSHYEACCQIVADFGYKLAQDIFNVVFDDNVRFDDESDANDIFCGRDEGLVVVESDTDIVIWEIDAEDLDDTINDLFHKLRMSCLGFPADAHLVPAPDFESPSCHEEDNGIKPLAFESFDDYVKA